MTDALDSLGPNFSFQDDDKPAKESNTADSVQSNYIHIRSQQRNCRKSLTTIQGINPKINKKVILKECKKKFNCNGTIVDDPDLGQVIQLQATSVRWSRSSSSTRRSRRGT